MVSSSQLLYSTDELLPCVSSHQQLRPLLESTRSTCTTIYTYNACLRTHFRDTYIPRNLRFSFGSCRFRCIIFVLLLTCLAAFALTLLVCLFACRRKRNDRTRRGPMQRGATLPLPSRWPSTKGCSNTCGQPHWFVSSPARATVWQYNAGTHASGYASATVHTLRVRVAKKFHAYRLLGRVPMWLTACVAATFC